MYFQPGARISSSRSISTTILVTNPGSLWPLLFSPDRCTRDMYTSCTNPPPVLWNIHRHPPALVPGYRYRGSVNFWHDVRPSGYIAGLSKSRKRYCMYLWTRYIEGTSSYLLFSPGRLRGLLRESGGGGSKGVKLWKICARLPIPESRWGCLPACA